MLDLFHLFTFPADKMMVVPFGGEAAEAVIKQAVFGGKPDQEPDPPEFLKDPVHGRKPQGGHFFPEKFMDGVRGLPGVVLFEKSDHSFPLGSDLQSVLLQALNIEFHVATARIFLF